MFVKSFLIVLVGAFALSSCTKNAAEDHFKSTQSQDSVLLQLSPYVIRQPEEVVDSIWYSHQSDSLRMHKLASLSTKLFKYHVDENGTQYYCVYQKDNRSLFEDYRGYGGKYKNVNGKVSDLEELFITPQLKIDQVKEVSAELFEEVVKSGDAKKYLGKPEKMQWPSETVVYNKKTHKWDITKDNAYHFVQEMKDSVEKATNGR